MFWKYTANLQENTHERNFNKVAKQLCWNEISEWVFSCKFAAYFQSNFTFTCQLYFTSEGPLLIIDVKVKTQCFSVKLREKVFNSYSVWKDLSMEYLVVSKFLLEVPKFKENVLICIIVAIKVRDLLLTPL